MAGVFSKSYSDSSDDNEESDIEERLCAEFLYEQLMGEQKKPNLCKLPEKTTYDQGLCWRILGIAVGSINIKPKCWKS